MASDWLYHAPWSSWSSPWTGFCPWSVWWDQDLDNGGPGQVLIDVLDNQEYAHENYKLGQADWNSH